MIKNYPYIIDDYEIPIEENSFIKQCRFFESDIMMLKYMFDQIEKHSVKKTLSAFCSRFNLLLFEAKDTFSYFKQLKAEIQRVIKKREHGQILQNNYLASSEMLYERLNKCFFSSFYTNISRKMLIDKTKYHSGALKFSVDKSSVLYSKQPVNLYFIKFDLTDGRPSV